MYATMFQGQDFTCWPDKQTLPLEGPRSPSGPELGSLAPLVICKDLVSSPFNRDHYASNACTGRADSFDDAVPKGGNMHDM